MEEIDRAHFYLHVSGEPADLNPDFSEIGAGEGPLVYRPSRYVPIQVPLFDEAATAELRQNDPKAEAQYQWVYRPEMQFSLFDLDQEEMQINQSDSDGEVHNLIHDELPVIVAGDEPVALIYSLLADELPVLETFGPGRTLVINIGDNEYEAVVGPNNELIFESLEVLSALDAEDFLAIRLYQNSDYENVLWEWAFEYLSIAPAISGSDLEDDIDGVYRISADDPILPFYAELAGYATRKPEFKEARTVRWSVDGAGYMYPSTETDQETGVFQSTLTMPPVAGNEAVVVAEILGNDHAKAKYHKVVVVPGEPANVDIVTEGEASMLGHGALNLEITVRDKNGNLVKDGTSVDLSISGDALLEFYDPATIDGKIGAVIKGTYYAGQDNHLIIQTGNHQQEVPFEIFPLNVAFDETAGEFRINRLETVGVVVTDHTGQPAQGVDVTFSTTFGEVKENLVTTDGDGRAQVILHTGFQTGQGELVAQMGYTQGDRHSFVVEDEPGGGQLDIGHAMVVGDAATDGYVTHERYDGHSMDLNYGTRTDITALGVAGETVQVTLGSLAEPNIEPLFALYMNRLEEFWPEPAVLPSYMAPDELGLHDAYTQNVEVAHDNPNGVGSSYALDGTGELTVSGAPALVQDQGAGFRLDFKAATFGGDLFNHDDGMHRLRLAGDGRLIYSIQTDSSEFELSSATPITLGSWNTVAGRYLNGQLELQINGAPVQVLAASGNLQYKTDSPDLKIGRSFNGNLNGFRWYDWNSQPLLTLPNGQQQMNVTLDSTGAATITIQSTGQLGQKQQGSSLRTLRVGLTGNTTQRYISIISKAAYLEIAGNIVDNPALFDQAPPVDLAYLPYQPGPMDWLVPPAYADFMGIINSAWSVTKSVASFLIPYEDFLILGKQLYYLGTQNWEQFDPVDLTFSALSVASVIPVAKPLQAVIKPLRVFVKHSNNKVLRAIAGAVGQAVKLAANGKTQKLIDVLPCLMIIGEMMIDEEAREGALLMIRAIRSADDLWGWIDYFNLPTDGWEGDGEPPSVQISAVVSPPSSIMQAANSVSDWIVAPAYAGPAPTFARVRGRVFGILVARLKNEMQDLLEKSPGALSDAVAIIAKEVKSTSLKEFRGLVNNERFLKAATKMARDGKANLKAFIKGNSNARLPVPVIVGITAYLATNWNDFTADDQAAILTKFGIAFAGAASGYKGQSENSLGGMAHGALFELSQIAFYHAKQKLAGKEIIGVECSRKITLFEKDAFGNNVSGKTILRKLDLILPSDDGKEVWYEFKSKAWISAARFKNDFAQYDIISKKGSTYHKQFFLDRVAMNNVESVRDKDKNPILVEDVRWRFQKFAVNRTINGKHVQTQSYGSNNIGTYNTAGTVRYLLSQWPNTSNKKAARDSIMASMSINSLSKTDYNLRNEHIDLNTLNRFVTDVASEIFDAKLKEVFDLLIEQGYFSLE